MGSWWLKPVERWMRLEWEAALNHLTAQADEAVTLPSSRR